MTRPENGVAEGLENAMRAELEGHHFYRMAAQATPDPQGRRVFETLAEEELEHLRFLRAQAQALSSTGRTDPEVRLGQPHRFEGQSPIFSPAIRARIAEAHFEMTALSVGIQLELAAERFYAQMARSSSDETVGRFYEELAAWEAGHYRTLLTQQEALRQDYWAASGFAPF